MTLLLVLLGVLPNSMSAQVEEVTSLQGAGTEDNPYLITNRWELEYFAYKVNNSDWYYSVNSYFLLTADIAINDCKIIDGNGELVCDTTKLTSWRPIGDSDKAFQGVFDGGGHTISGIYINNPRKGEHGLFGCISRSYGQGVVRNLTLANSYIQGKGSVGGIVGEEWGRVINCVNKATVCGVSVSNVGGIVGQSEGNVVGCVNEGKVTATARGSNVGGIAGYMSDGEMTGCKNLSDISSALDSVSVGGIVGSAWAVDGVNWTSNCTIQECVNNGDITVTDTLSYAGGISGNTRKTDIYSCVNNGNVASHKYYAAGICPYGTYYTDVERCVNRGDVRGCFDVGGIIGNTADGVRGCVNFGRVTSVEEGDGNVGGIVGRTRSSHCYVMHSANRGMVSGGFRNGGIVGLMSSGMHINKCYNAGTIYSRMKAYVGGLAGYSSLSIENSYNVGDVVSYGEGSHAGGLAGYFYDYYDGWNRTAINTSYNAGDVYSYGKGTNAGNIAGNNNQAYYSRCWYVKGNLHGSGYANPTASCYSTVTEEELKTLAASINVSDWWDEMPTYVQGHFRPILTNSDRGDDFFVCNALTAEGDTTAIDLGKPFDNTLFYAIGSLPNAKDAYNVVHGDTIEHLYVVDGQEYMLNQAVHVGDVAFKRNVSLKTDTIDLCLPFEVAAADLPLDSKLYVLSAVKDGVAYMSNVESVPAGVAFLCVLPAAEGVVRIGKRLDARLEYAAPDTQSPFFGVYAAKSADTDELVFRNGEFVRLDADVAAFRTAIKCDGCERLSVELCDDVSTGIQETSVAHTVHAANGKVAVGNLKGRSEIRLYDVTGTLLHSATTDAGKALIPATKKGVNILVVNGKATKVVVR